VTEDEMRKRLEALRIDHRDLDALTELGIDIEWVKDPNNQHDK
jgi:hypothetical protein